MVSSCAWNGQLRVVADHERGAVRAQQLVDRLREPALVAELEAVAARAAAAASAPAEPVVVALEVRRELPHDRPELAGLGERLDALVVAPDALGEVLQPLDVGQVAARLGGERRSSGGVCSTQRATASREASR